MWEHVVVNHVCIDGAHFFTSDDGMGKGLCAANRDFNAGLAEVIEQLRELARLNHGVDCEVFVTFGEELRWPSGG